MFGVIGVPKLSAVVRSFHKISLLTRLRINRWLCMLSQSVLVLVLSECLFMMDSTAEPLGVHRGCDCMQYVRNCPQFFDIADFV